MATIEFKPVCSLCGYVIKGTVDYNKRRELLEGSDSIFKIGQRITPRKCPNCGEYFDGIIMPTRLPYKEEN